MVALAGRHRTQRVHLVWADGASGCPRNVGQFSEDSFGGNAVRGGFTAGQQVEPEVGIGRVGRSLAQVLDGGGDHFTANQTEFFSQAGSGRFNTISWVPDVKASPRSGVYITVSGGGRRSICGHGPQGSGRL